MKGGLLCWPVNEKKKVGILRHTRRKWWQLGKPGKERVQVEPALPGTGASLWDACRLHILHSFTPTLGWTEPRPTAQLEQDAVSKVTFNKVQGAAETNSCHFRRCNSQNMPHFQTRHTGLLVSAASGQPSPCPAAEPALLSLMKPLLVSSLRNTVSWAVTVHKSVLAQVSDLFYFSEVEERLPCP